ncbi:hypothetical protein [Candidatus Poriferisodalis sp.]|uniref:hypothetical protein n=1 Tax=Candidatus Poriferisodalis sp. TaxID=3101277 RepID=UPI003B0164E3
MFGRRRRAAEPPRLASPPPLDAEELEILRVLVAQWRSLWENGRPDEADVQPVETMIALCATRLVGVGYRETPTAVVPEGELDPDNIGELRRLVQRRHEVVIDLDLTEREREADLENLSALIAHQAADLLSDSASPNSAE